MVVRNLASGQYGIVIRAAFGVCGVRVISKCRGMVIYDTHQLRTWKAKNCRRLNETECSNAELMRVANEVCSTMRLSGKVEKSFGLSWR